MAYYNGMDVTCAIIRRGSEILALRRPSGASRGGKWEFPGGKLEPGETAEACLRRELREELAIEVRLSAAMSPYRFDYPDFSIRLIPFVCELAAGAFELREHAEACWAPAAELRGLDWAAADVQALEEYIERFGSDGGGREGPA
jgi:8-oxo-dGTP diphosphatase